MFELLSTFTIADFIKGLVIGVSIAAPVGPIGVLCMRTTLADGMLAGFVTGLGAAAADAIYAAIGALGIAAVTTLLNSAGLYLRIAGIAVLLWIAWGTWRQTPGETAASTGAKGKSLWLAFAGTCALTLTNPMTILSFAAIFAGAGLAATGANATSQAVTLVAGTFIGSMAWWLILSGSVAAFRAKIGPRTLSTLNKVSALILLGFAVWMGWQALLL
ncbi:MAG: LysE family transporter [Rhodospirillaceae bacterium]|nr:LysE family transporter [Rhodospirillaceae bacterium]